MKTNSNLTLASVILYYNTPEKTKKCLENCFKSENINQHIILVDNNSLKRPLKDLLESISIPENFTILKNNSNLGFSAGINRGIKYAIKYLNPDYIAIINSDLYVNKNALSNSIKRLNILKNNLKIGALTAKILMEDKKYIWQAGGHINLLRMSGIAYGLREKDSKKFSSPQFVRWASGAFSVFPTKVLKEIGLFSEDFFFGQEEWDYSLRLTKNKYLIYYDPEVVATHSVGGSYRSSHPVLNTFNGYCNKVLMAKKHFSFFKYFLWLIIFELRTFIISISIALKHSYCKKDCILQLKAIFLSLLIAPFIKRTNNQLLKKASKFIGVSPTWPNYWESDNISKEDKKVIVVHSGRRDNYLVARGINKQGKLKYLVTDFYFKGIFKFIFKRKVFKFLSTKFIQRSHLDLPQEKVIISKSAIIFSILNRILNKFNIENHFEEMHDYCIARKANKLSNKHNCHIISYSTYATRSFKNIKNKKILFQMHPYVDFVRESMEDEFKKNPSCKSSLKEYEFRIFSKTLKNLRLEPFVSDYIICPSSFCHNSLPKLKNDIKLFTIPYGSRFKTNNFKLKKFNEFNILFIGSIVQRKGILYLLKVAKNLEKYKINLIIVTRSINDRYLYKEASKIRNVKIFKNINNNSLKKVFKESHIFLLPSLIEGFAHVILESMNYGLVPIVSPFCCGPDIIKNNKNGYILNPNEISNISEKIIYLYKNRKVFNSLSKNAFITSREYTEEEFIKNLNKFFEENIY